jgi:methionine synthase I (cobalamin-dependent)
VTAGAAKVRFDKPMRTLRDLLSDGRVHVVDGAMGTVIYGHGIFLNVG